MSDALPGGTLRLSDTLTLTRVGYGALQLAGPMAYGPPATATRHWPSCAPRPRRASRISTPATTTARTS